MPNQYVFLKTILEYEIIQLNTNFKISVIMYFRQNSNNLLAYCGKYNPVSCLHMAFVSRESVYIISYISLVKYLATWQTMTLDQQEWVQLILISSFNLLFFQMFTDRINSNMHICTQQYFIMSALETRQSRLILH